jgi:hypothetical protein
LLLQRCRGLDMTEVVDDQGGLPKTVSVENSFRRGSVQTLQAVWSALEELLVRLPRLLRDRKSWSDCPDNAFPVTIRLTVRLVDSNLQDKKRTSRPFVTRSKQKPLDGKDLFILTDLLKQADFLKQSISPLVSQLMVNAGGTNFNVTRLNLAVTNFQDIPTPISSPGSAGHFHFPLSQHRPRNPETDHHDNAHAKNPPTERHHFSSTSTALKRRNLAAPSAIDPSVLSQLPQDIAEEVRRDYHSVTKKTRIDHFFSSRKGPS